MSCIYGKCWVCVHAPETGRDLFMHNKLIWLIICYHVISGKITVQCNDDDKANICENGDGLGEVTQSALYKPTYNISKQNG